MLSPGELRRTYAGKTVLVTGHTGFKGSWLAEWLLLMEADVVGVALEPSTTPSLFVELKLDRRLRHHVQDIRDAAVVDLIVEVRPDFVFHLAAQPLVRQSYRAPVETFATNVMGTVHVLEALRRLDREQDFTCASVFVTTDKCYSNQEWLYGYRENDPLGGHDPYSASKAAAELAVSSYRQSFMSAGHTRPRVGIASARAGNVIGGGDWAEDRIIPDCMRSLAENRPISVRNPEATRPWQHVLEPLGGYLLLGAMQARAIQAGASDRLAGLSTAFNFGPHLQSNRSVEAMVEEVLRYWPGRWERVAGTDVHEAGKLNLVWDRAFHTLGWHPVWSFERTVEKTVRWYRAYRERAAPALTLVNEDIDAYEDAWAGSENSP